MSNQENFESVISEMANYTLDRAVSNEISNCSDKGFANATLLFEHFFISKLWEYCEKNNIPQREREQMAENAGRYLHQHIKTFTGVDMHEIFKK